MLKEALELLFREAKNGANPVPHERRLGHRKYAVTVNGQTTIEEREKPRLERHASTLASVADLVSSFKGDKATAYVGKEQVEVILDDSDRQEKVYLSMEPSVQAKALLRLVDGVSQRVLIRTLRTDLAGCVQNEQIIPLVRQMEFGVDRTSRSDINRDSESMGRTVERAVRARAGEIPDELLVRFPLFSVPSDVPSEVELVCAVDIDLENEKVALIPRGDSWDREIHRVLSQISDRLESLTDGVTVVDGFVVSE